MTKMGSMNANGGVEAPGGEDGKQPNEAEPPKGSKSAMRPRSAYNGANSAARNYSRGVTYGAARKQREEVLQLGKTVSRVTGEEPGRSGTKTPTNRGVTRVNGKASFAEKSFEKTPGMESKKNVRTSATKSPSHVIRRVDTGKENLLSHKKEEKHTVEKSEKKKVEEGKIPLDEESADEEEWAYNSDDDPDKPDGTVGHSVTCEKVDMNGVRKLVMT